MTSGRKSLFPGPCGRLRQTAAYDVDSLHGEHFNITNRYDWVMGTAITRGSNDHPVRNRLGNTRLIVTCNPSNGFSSVTVRNSIRPYSDLSGSTGHWVFGTYEQGSSADDADQRWYKNDVGRFTTADPYQASGGASDAGSWNRSSYVGDPVNFNDPFGLDKTAAVSCAEARAQALAAGGSDFFCFTVTGTGSAPGDWSPDYNSDPASNWYRAQMPDVLAQNQPVAPIPATGQGGGPSSPSTTRPVNSQRCGTGGGVGLVAGADIGIGLVAGAFATVSGGGGLTVGPRTGRVGGFLSGGAAAVNGSGRRAGAPGRAEINPEIVVGVAIGAGVGGYLTNASSNSQLKGAFRDSPC